MQRSTKEAFPGSSVLISLVPLLPLQAPKFPSFAELVDQDLLQQQKNGLPKTEGLFSAMLGDPRLLLLDLLDAPEKYEEGVSSLVQELVSGQKNLQSLDVHEQALLDRAVLDFTRPKQIKPVEPPAKPRVPKHSQEEEAGTLEHAYEDTPLPPGMADAYWWLK